MSSLRINSVVFARHSGVVFSLLLTLVVTGCVTQSVIRHPPGASAGNPPTVVNPVDIVLEWGQVQYRSGEPYVLLDGNNVTANFGGGIQCCVSASASFTLPPGRHDLQVGVPRSQTLGTHIETLPFDVVDPSFSLQLSPASLSLVPGGSGTTSATITPTGGFNGQVTLTVSGLAAGTTSAVTALSATAQRILVTAAATAPGAMANATVTGTAPCGPSCGGAATTTVTVPLSVNVIGPGIRVSAITPNNVVVPRGGSAHVTVTVQRAGGFSGPISIAAANLPSAVTSAPAQIDAGMSAATMTLSAAGDAGLAGVAGGTAPATRQISLALTGVCSPACPAITASENFSARVGRRSGVFAIAAPALKNAPSTASSQDARVGLSYAVASPQPPGATQFTATYTRSGSPGALYAVNLEQSAFDWGAGFCAADPVIAGVVLSGTYGGITNAPLFYVLPIWSPGPAPSTARGFSQPMYAINSDAGTTIVPMLWYSPDCTLAAYLQSSFAAAPPASLVIIDMTNGQPIATAMPFAGAPPSRIEVVAGSTGQLVRVQFTPSDIRTAPIP